MVLQTKLHSEYLKQIFLFLTSNHSIYTSIPIISKSRFALTNKFYSLLLIYKMWQRQDMD